MAMLTCCDLDSTGDPKHPFAHVHLHAVKGKWDLASYYRKTLVYNFMGWYELEDLIAEIRYVAFERSHDWVQGLAVLIGCGISGRVRAITESRAGMSIMQRSRSVKRSSSRRKNVT